MRIFIYTKVAQIKPKSIFACKKNEKTEKKNILTGEYIIIIKKKLIKNRCLEYFEGPNCEFSVMDSILYDSSEIPGK